MGDNIFCYAIEKSTSLKLCVDVHTDAVYRLADGEFIFPENLEDIAKIKVYEAKTNEPLPPNAYSKELVFSRIKSYLAFRQLETNLFVQAPMFSLEDYAVLYQEPAAIAVPTRPFTDFERNLLESTYRKQSL